MIGALSPGYLRVELPGTGLLDGGEIDWPIEWVPEEARRPNGQFEIAGFKDGVPQVVGPQNVFPGDAADPLGLGVAKPPSSDRDLYFWCNLKRASFAPLATRRLIRDVVAIIKNCVAELTF